MHTPATTTPESSSVAPETGWDWACWRQAEEPAGPQHGTVWDLSHLTEANLNHMPIVREEPAFRDFDCRVQLQQKKLTWETVPGSLQHLGKIQGREDARGSLTFWDGANEEFGSKSLQTLGGVQVQICAFQLHTSPLLWYLVSLGSPALFFKKQPWKPIGFSSV